MRGLELVDESLRAVVGADGVGRVVIVLGLGEGSFVVLVACDLADDGRKFGHAVQIAGGDDFLEQPEVARLGRKCQLIAEKPWGGLAALVVGGHEHLADVPFDCVITCPFGVLGQTLASALGHGRGESGGIYASKRGLFEGRVPHGQSAVGGELTQGSHELRLRLRLDADRKHGLTDCRR